MVSTQAIFLSVLLYISADMGRTSDIYTSLRQVKLALDNLGTYLGAMDAFVEKEEARLQGIRRDIKAWREDSRKSELYDLEHPVDAYKFIARWQHLTELATDTSTFKAFTNDLATQLIPVMAASDRIGAARAILRLQNVYNISCAVMASGDIHGHQASGLALADMEFIGRLALTDEHPRLAHCWFQLALAAIEDITATRSRILSAIGQSHFNMTQYEEAVAATQNALNLDPYNDEIAEQLREYTQVLMPYEPDHHQNNDTANVHGDRGTRVENSTIVGEESDASGMQYGDEMGGSGSAAGNDTDNLICTDSSNCTLDTDEALHVNMTEEEEMEKQIAEHTALLWNLYETLCRGDQIRDFRLESRLYCRYRATDIPYAKVKEEVMNFDPRIMMLYDVITDSESHFLINEAIPKLQRARVGAPDVKKQTEGRVSQTSWFYDFQYNGTIKKISDRIASVTGLGTEYRPQNSMAEALQVNNYGLGGQYETHMDAFRDPEAIDMLDGYIKGTGDRVATFMFYLTDVTAGGATVFPMINVRVTPVKGAAVFWYNLRRNGEADNWSMHAGCPVLLGEKWVANKWIHERGQEFRRPCGLNVDDFD